MLIHRLINLSYSACSCTLYFTIFYKHRCLHHAAQSILDSIYHQPHDFLSISTYWSASLLYNLDSSAIASLSLPKLQEKF